MNDDRLSGLSKSCIDILGKEWKYECMGCGISNKEITPPGGIIYEGKSCVLAGDPEVPIPGFLVISSKKHVKAFSDYNEEERHELVDVLYWAEKVLKELNICNEITIVQEERSSHFHIWIFPYHEWMKEKFGKGISYLRDISSYAKENADEEVVKEVLDVIDKVKDRFKEIDIK